MAQGRKKVLIHAINGIGFGHVVRTKRIADALKILRPDVEIVFASNTKHPDYLKKDYKVYPLKKDSRDVVERKYSYAEYMEYTAMALEKIISHEDPDLFVCDCDFSRKTLLVLTNRSIKAAYILRNSKPGRFQDIRKYFPSFDVIIIPHTKEDVPKDQRDYLDRFHAHYVGPVLDTTRPAEGVKRNKILITLGTGADIEDNKPLFEAVENFLKYLKVVPDFLTDNGLALEIITGPYFDGGCEFCGFPVTRSTDSMVREFYGTKVAISAAGYNTINEIIASKTPAVIVPLPRKWDDQFGRAQELEKQGCVRIGKCDLVDQVTEVIKNWESMHQAFPEVTPGNTKAAQVISDTLELASAVKGGLS